MGFLQSLFLFYMTRLISPFPPSSSLPPINDILICAIGHRNLLFFFPLFGELSHKIALILRAYVTVVCQEGQSYSEIKSCLRSSVRGYDAGVQSSREDITWCSPSQVTDSDQLRRNEEVHAPPPESKAGREVYCLFLQAFAATAFILWLTYVPCFFMTRVQKYQPF